MKKCFNCGKKGSEAYGYSICDSCRSKLRLFTEKTIQRHVDQFKSSDRYLSYAEEIKDRLVLMEKDYIKKRIKLLNILDQIDFID